MSTEFAPSPSMKIWTPAASRWVAVVSVLVLLLAVPMVVRGQAERPSRVVTVSLPGLSWTLELEAPGFVVETDRVQADGRGRYLYAINRQTDLVLSVRLEAGAQERTSRGCRAGAWEALRARSPFRMDEVLMSDLGELAVVEYVVKDVRGLPVKQKHVHGHLGRGEVCVELHLSKVRFRPADAPLFTAILQSVRVREQLDL